MHVIFALRVGVRNFRVLVHFPVQNGYALLYRLHGGLNLIDYKGHVGPALLLQLSSPIDTLFPIKFLVSKAKLNKREKSCPRSCKSLTRLLYFVRSAVKSLPIAIYSVD
jgi:hypothetical protein